MEGREAGEGGGDLSKSYRRWRQSEDPSLAMLHSSWVQGPWVPRGHGRSRSMDSPRSLGRRLGYALAIIKAQSALISVFLK